MHIDIMRLAQFPPHYKHRSNQHEQQGTQPQNATFSHFIEKLIMGMRIEVENKLSYLPLFQLCLL